MPMNGHEEIMMDDMQITDAQTDETLTPTRANHLKEDSDISDLMEAVALENEEAFRELAK